MCTRATTSVWNVSYGTHVAETGKAKNDNTRETGRDLSCDFQFAEEKQACAQCPESVIFVSYLFSFQLIISYILCFTKCTRVCAHSWSLRPVTCWVYLHITSKWCRWHPSVGGSVSSVHSQTPTRLQIPTRLREIYVPLVMLATL